MSCKLNYDSSIEVTPLKASIVTEVSRKRPNNLWRKPFRGNRRKIGTPTVRGDSPDTSGADYHLRRCGVKLRDSGICERQASPSESEDEQEQGSRSLSLDRLKQDNDNLRNDVTRLDEELDKSKLEIASLKKEFLEEISKLRKKVVQMSLEASINLYEAGREDSELLDDLRSIEFSQYSERQQKHLLPHLQRIIRIFKHRYKETFLEKVRLKVNLSDAEAEKVNCLTLAVSLLSQINIEDNLPSLVDDLLGYLRDLSEILLPNMVVARMTQIFLTSICNASDRCHITVTEEGRETLLRTFTNYRGNNFVRIPSTYLLVVIFNRLEGVFEGEVFLEAVKYLSEIMETSASTNLHGFCFGPPQKRLIKLAFSKVLL